MKKLIFFAKHMEIGGLEKSLLNLLNSLDPKEYSVELVLEELHGPLLEQLGSHISVEEYGLSSCNFVPLRKIIPIITPATSMVTDIFGSRIMRRQISAPAPMRGKMPRKIFTSAREIWRSPYERLAPHPRPH